MTFNELDKRAIEWNQIANGHRTPENRYDVQIDMCNEEMLKEYFYWYGEFIKYERNHDERKILIEMLDGIADSFFVFAELRNILKLADPQGKYISHFYFMFDLALDTAKPIFGEDTIIKAYHRVIESNFSKFVQSDDMTLEQAILESNVISLAYNCKCDPELINDYWVFRDQNGKIRKPSTFKTVDLSDLIQEIEIDYRI